MKIKQQSIELCYAIEAARASEALTKCSVLGQQPLCENDTDGDGNCHLCARKGGCFWPNTQGLPRAGNAAAPTPSTQSNP